MGRILKAGVRGAMTLSTMMLCALGNGQTSPDEHAAHHPGPTAGGTNASGTGGMGGMMEGMGEMMKGMFTPPPKELYPSLMALPELTPEQRREVDRLAGERMWAGTDLMARALDALNNHARSNNYAAMQEATTLLREGIAQFDSGIAARRALVEGKAPQGIAMAWFKREMNLQPPVAGGEAHGARGLSWFHLFTMGLLIVFAFAMLAMYFFKMRRAAALFGRIESDGSSPPPGSAPPLA